MFCCMNNKARNEEAILGPRKDLRHHLIKYDLKSFENHFEATVAMSAYSCRVLARGFQGVTSGVCVTRFMCRYREPQSVQHPLCVNAQSLCVAAFMKD